MLTSPPIMVCFINVKLATGAHFNTNFTLFKFDNQLKFNTILT